MKKNLLLFCLIVSSVTYLPAQKDFEPGLDIGISGTFSASYILKQNNYGTLDPFTNAVVRESELAYKATWGGNGGVCLGYRITKNWGVQTEIQYDIAGQNYEDNFTGPAVIKNDTLGSATQRVNVQRTVKLNYIQIPLMAKYTVGKSKYKFFACLGPQFGIRTYAYQQVKIDGNVYVPDSLNFSSAQRFQTFDFGIALQAGGQFYATKHLYFDIGLSAYQGVYDINGSVLRNLGWYDKNHLSYQKSYNFRGGIMVGIHYAFFREAKETLKLTTPESR
jgi:outer membrane protein with beta-barrel domain